MIQKKHKKKSKLASGGDGDTDLMKADHEEIAGDNTPLSSPRDDKPAQNGTQDKVCTDGMLTVMRIENSFIPYVCSKLLVIASLIVLYMKLPHKYFHLSLFIFYTRMEIFLYHLFVAVYFLFLNSLITAPNVLLKKLPFVFSLVFLHNISKNVAHVRRTTWTSGCRGRTLPQ